MSFNRIAIGSHWQESKRDGEDKDWDIFPLSLPALDLISGRGCIPPGLKLLSRDSIHGANAHKPLVTFSSCAFSAGLRTFCSSLSLGVLIYLPGCIKPTITSKESLHSSVCTIRGVSFLARFLTNKWYRFHFLIL